MKILLLTPPKERPYHCISECAHALGVLGHEVRSASSPREIARELVAAGLQGGTPFDLALTINGIGLDTKGAIANALRAFVAPFAIWLVDDPAILLPQIGEEAVSGAAVVACWERSYLEHVRGFGARRALWLPLAAGALHYEQPSPKIVDPRPLFAGSWSERRAWMLEAVPDCIVYGDERWLRSVGHDRYRGLVPYGEHLFYLYRTHALTINITEGNRSSPNQRPFDVPAAGGRLVTDWCADLDDMFIGDAVTCFDTREELAEICAARGILTDGIMRRRTELARREIEARHLYTHRMTTLLEAAQGESK